MDSPFPGPLTALCSHTSFFSKVLKQKQNIGPAKAEGAFEFFLKRKLTLPNQCTSCVCCIRQRVRQDLAGIILNCRISSWQWGCELYYSALICCLHLFWYLEGLFESSGDLVKTVGFDSVVLGGLRFSAILTIFQVMYQNHKAVSSWFF